MLTPARVFLVESREIVRLGLEQVIGDASWLRLVGYAQTGEDGPDEIMRMAPDIVILEVRNSRTDYILLTKLLREQNPSTKLVWLAQGCPSNSRLAATTSPDVTASVDGSKQELLAAIEKIVRLPTSPTIPGSGNSTHSTCALSPREKEILTLIGRGLLDKEIASELSIGIRTVDTHKEHIRGKLGLRSKNEMIAFAVRHAFSLCT